MGALYRFDLQPLIDKYELVNYVETGTGTGSCLNHARQYNFQQFYSIELDEEFFNNLKYIEISDPRVNLINDYSTQAFKMLLPKLSSEPCLIWLDAHFIGNSDHGKCSYEESILKYGQDTFPLEEELKLLKLYRDISKDVIIIDDFVLYSKDEPCEWAKNNTFQQRKLAEDCGVNLNSEFIYKNLSETHFLNKDQRDQCYLIALPKI